MMKLSASERQTLVGPLTIGCILGGLVSLASLGFDSEYGHIGWLQMGLNAVAGFLAGVATATVPLGILPIVIQRIRRIRRKVKAENDCSRRMGNEL